MPHRGLITLRAGCILELTGREYAGQAATEDRLYELLAELPRDREEGARKWDEQNRKWDAHRAQQRIELDVIS